MALGTSGLKTQIWNNNLKSIALLVSYPFVLLAMIWAFFALTLIASEQSSPTDMVLQMLPGITIVVVVWFAIAWIFHQTMINASTGAQPLTRREAPQIYNMLENMCISVGMPMPQLQIMETPALNAFASGLSDKHYTVTLTRGIIDALDDDELEAVIGHELSHIRHRDVRLLVISVIFVGMISYLANIAFRSMMWGGSSRRQGMDGRIYLIALLVLGVGYVASILVRFALSRRREYMADAGSVALTKNPDAMIRALQKISGRADMPSISGDIKQMCIENAAGFMGGMFATHPPIEQRIAALVSLGGRVEELQSYATEAEQLQSEYIGQTDRTPFMRRHGPWD
jgi:heat shock protein HtpX